MPNFKITREIVVECNLPKGTVLVPVEKDDEFVTWFRRVGEVVKISTCPIEEFDCQNSTESIDLFISDIKKIAAMLK
jgi:hypothetical protein